MTWSGGHFVAAGRRRHEAIGSIGSLGVRPDRQTFAGMPDGNLIAQTEAVTEHVIEAAKAVSAERLYSFGPEGYDNHLDHVAVYLGTRVAALELGVEQVVRLPHGRGDTVFRGPRTRKLDIMAAHPSQFDVTAAAQVAWYERYSGGFTAEHYQTLAPATL